jgi:hypothetical protein
MQFVIVELLRQLHIAPPPRFVAPVPTAELLVNVQFVIAELLQPLLIAPPEPAELRHFLLSYQ